MFDKYFTQGTELSCSSATRTGTPATDPARHNYPDGFHFKWGVDTVKTQTAILASNGDDATTPQLGPDRLLAHPQIEGEKKAQFDEGPSSCVLMVNLDTRKIPLPVRKAIAVAYPFDSGAQGRRRDHAVRSRPPARSSRRRSPATSTTGRGCPASR